MDINIKTVDQAVVIELDGKLDGRAAPQVQAEIAPHLQPGCKIILDMTRLTYMSSAGLRLLATMHRQVSDNDGEFVLAALGERIRDTMSITGFLPFFAIYDTVDAALAGPK